MADKAVFQHREKNVTDSTALRHSEKTFKYFPHLFLQHRISLVGLFSTYQIHGNVVSASDFYGIQLYRNKTVYLKIKLFCNL